jgi:predicted RNase H-like nuclease (RuvC/YqgF family)
MILRICLIIALVGGLAATVVNFVKVKAVITNTIAERDDEKKQKVAALADASKAHKDLKATQAERDAVKKDLAATKTQLEEATAKVTDLTAQNTTLTSDLAKVRGERDTIDQELSKWKQLNTTPQQVIDMRAELAKTQAANSALLAEVRFQSRKIGDLTNEINQLVGNETIPPLPAGLRGTVLAVDPKYAFVVLNIGDESGVVKRGVMVVARGDKFIGKVQIDKVENNKCVANVMPEWSQGPIIEGDQVLY